MVQYAELKTRMASSPFGKRLDGRDEQIVDPEQGIVDAHHHLFDRPALRYLVDDYLDDVNAGHRIVASVYVETLAFARIDGPELLRPLGEVEFANGVGAMSASGIYGESRVCAAIVGYADLRAGDAVAELVDRMLEVAPDRFRGVRQVTIESSSDAPFRFMTHPPPRGILTHPEFRRGFRQLAPRGLSFDAAVFHPQLGDIAALADAFPDTTIMLDNLGIAMALDLDADGLAAVFPYWSASMRELARRPNVLCKIAGLGMPFWGFGFESRPGPIASGELTHAWKPWIETAIEAFGAQRCMMASNFPMDGRSCGFVPSWNALKRIVQQCSQAEKAALFRDTAARAYRLRLAPDSDRRPIDG